MQTRNRFRPLCLLLLLAAASACCPCRKYQKLYGAPLVGTRWLLIQLDGEEVANSDGRFSLRFEDAKRLSDEAAATATRPRATRRRADICASARSPRHG